MNTCNTAQDNADTLRKRLRDARAKTTSEERNNSGLRIRARLHTWLAIHLSERPEDSPPPVIAAYWPLELEPDLRPLLRKWDQEEGHTLALPVIDQPGQPLRFRQWTTDTPMQTGLHGIEEPAEGQWLTPDIILVPTLGYTREADRLGYGGGYYDRTLAALRDDGHAFVTIGVAWSIGEFKRKDHPPADHDFRLDAIATEAKWVPEAP
ncbi:5-formyltetrahydrofolate cyclo-ligase [Corticimicrobacter populi]|uniref:5-formyltetrahydrofolate cyclo-ligase n=1 Tax=Corticimicrobacter populi TaxID=2175229 RepID=A0A2V1JYK4_9BURK|nr:5-formyltetrahydrofolate cyclo-ligase [Corticimicrobacter populi]PWF21076.1 5-formyltetrahydrofolate cyclo-ligase [Corticimicrobacter populi]QDQ88444.1 5-formyltetrahydrofolate cyclo-ligase [Alcaligenaceae bacterium SJ-26]